MEKVWKTGRLEVAAAASLGWSHSAMALILTFFNPSKYHKVKKKQSTTVYEDNLFLAE